MKATNRRTEYVGSFVKASGEVRTMRFTTSPEKLSGKGMLTVFDVEKRQLRRFNLATLIGRLIAVDPNGQIQMGALA